MIVYQEKTMNSSKYILVISLNNVNIPITSKLFIKKAFEQIVEVEWLIDAASYSVFFSNYDGLINGSFES